MTTTADRGSTSSGKYKVVGTRPIRHDGLDKVTGRANFGADIQLAGLLHGKVLRSPFTHARIRSIDTSKAESLPGVRAVVTARDFPIIEDKVIEEEDVYRIGTGNNSCCREIIGRRIFGGNSIDSPGII